MKNPYHGGHGLLLHIIGGRIGMVDTQVEHTVAEEQYITKSLDILLIKSQDHGVAQVVMRMRAHHQVGMADTEGLEAGLAVDMEGTANQCGG